LCEVVELGCSNICTGPSISIFSGFLRSDYSILSFCVTSANYKDYLTLFDRF